MHLFLPDDFHSGVFFFYKRPSIYLNIVNIANLLGDAHVFVGGSRSALLELLLNVADLFTKKMSMQDVSTA